MLTLNFKMKTLNLITLVAFLFLFVIFNVKVLSFNVPTVSAQSRLTYPIADLGYCRDAKECYLYCQIPENKSACWSYGKYKVGRDVLGVTTMSEDEKRMMESKAKKYSVTFPIADLGNCSGPQECRDFCEQPANQTACMDFAKKKGFDKEMQRPPEGMDTRKRDELLEKAKTELGCTSMESCKSTCQQYPERCESFAKKHGVYEEPPEGRGRYSAQKKQELMQKAQSELGCTSMESCKSTCEQYPERCMAFAKKHGFNKDEQGQRSDQEQSGPLRPSASKANQYQQGEPQGTSPNFGTQRFGKGSCDSEESCKTYCREHPDECPGFQGYTRATQAGSQSSTQIQQQSQGSYMGPSGCRTEAECESWCKGNPDKCPGFREAKTQEESGKREYELKKKQMEQNQETQKRQFENEREMMKQNYEYWPPRDGSTQQTPPPSP
ncbi:hypothetical protein HY949_03280 [Candidatus Gottesmanbacteria bacterium]|nr:hypothetical protein [Candidatus Gottesmanbacteria bacterium]